MTEQIAATGAVPVPAKTRPRPLSAHEVWDQRRDENDLWYIRFLRYVALGPGRSVSLVAKGKRNAYPVPAHWPVQAKQLSWKARAVAFDGAAKAKPSLVKIFNTTLASFIPKAQEGDEATALALAVSTGGYQVPPDEEDWQDEPRAASSR